MRTRWLPVLVLAVLAPVCAEYLWGYDDSTGHPLTLLGNLVVFVPLYGAPALLIRELARRRGLGWPGILLLATAFGVIQAGIVDQSMWAREYRGIPYWSDLADPTYIAPIGLSVFLAVSFVANHVLASMAGPIALTEALSGRRAGSPWLGRPVVVLLMVLYLCANALVYADMLSFSDGPIASLPQVAASAAVAALLVAAALRCGTRLPTLVAQRPPTPWLLAPVAFGVTSAAQSVTPSPLGTDLLIGCCVLAALAVWWLSLRPGWSPAHVAALALGWLTAFAVFSFWTEPIGTVTSAEKLGHNLGALCLVAGLGAFAVLRSGAASPGTRTDAVRSDSLA